MKHLLITTIAAVVLVGCGPSMSLHEAVRWGDIETVKQHLAAGADVNAKGDAVKQPANAPKLDGHNILPIVGDAKAKSKHKILHFAWGNRWAVREGDWKLIGTKGNARSTLHNLADVKPEKRDYANARPEIVQRLRNLHAEWAKEVQLK